MSKPRPAFPLWTAEERGVIDRSARAIVEGRYRNVKEAVPECRRALSSVAPASGRTDLAIAWKLLCRAYDFGLPRRKHLWSREESRLIQRHVSAMARGEYPDTGTTVSHIKRDLVKAGLGVRHPDKEFTKRVRDSARKIGLQLAPPRLGRAEAAVIGRFSRALARNEYVSGESAAEECRRACVRAGIAYPRSLERLAFCIRARAKTMGWTPAQRPWNASGVRVINRFAQAVVSGEYPSIVAAVRICEETLKRAGEFENRTRAGLYITLRTRAIRRGLPPSRPRWTPDEKRIVDRFARAVVRGDYTTASAAWTRCRHALERAGFTEHLHGKLLRSRLRQRVHDIRLTR